MTESVDPWQEYRRRRNLARFAYSGGAPFVFVVGLVGERLFHSMAPASVVAVGWMIFIGATSIRWQGFRCPRCRKWFFGKWWYYNSFARRCVHCRLPKYAWPVLGHTDTPLLSGH
jgi:hypothetical protein